MGGVEGEWLGLWVGDLDGECVGLLVGAKLVAVDVADVVGVVYWQS